MIKVLSGRSRPARKELQMDKPEMDQAESQKETVRLRRGDRVVEKVSVPSLIGGIKKGKLRRTDEISMDGNRWVELGEHRKLGRLFASVENTPSSPPSRPSENLKKRLAGISEMLDEINSATPLQ